MKKLLLIVLACAATLPVAWAQTGRIAHFSHGGSVAALVIAAKVDDNLGTPVRMETEWRRDTLVVINELRVEHRGEARTWVAGAERERAVWYRKAEVWRNSVFDEETLLAYRKQHPDITLIGLAKVKTVWIRPSVAGNLSQALRDANSTDDFFAVDTVLKLTDSTAVRKGNSGVRAVYSIRVADTVNYARYFRNNRRIKSAYTSVLPAAPASADRAAYELFKSEAPWAKIIGFDTARNTGKPPVKNKKSEGVILVTSPQRPGMVMAALAVLGLAGAGWLLAGRHTVATS